MLSSIIIPVHNSEEFTLACIGSIRETTRDYEIIVVDNGSSRPFGAAKILNNLNKVRVIRNSENPGYSAAANQGIKQASGDNLVFMNNDTIVTPGWLEYLLWHLANGYDLVGPCTNSIAGPQRVGFAYKFVAGKLDSIDRQGLNSFAQTFHFRPDHLHKTRPHHLLIMFCVVVKRSVIEKIGLLDESLIGSFEDTDFSARAVDAGFRLGIAQDVFIHHWGGVTHKAMGLDMNAVFNRNQMIFERKWPPARYEQIKKRASA